MIPCSFLGDCVVTLSYIIFLSFFSFISPVSGLNLSSVLEIDFLFTL